MTATRSDTLLSTGLSSVGVGWRGVEIDGGEKGGESNKGSDFGTGGGCLFWHGEGCGNYQFWCAEHCCFC